MATVHRLLRHIDLTFCAGIGLLTLGFAAFPATNAVSVIAGGLLVFLVPGYALTLLLWKRGPAPAIGDRIVFSVGLSVALTVFSVLFLSVTGTGVTAFSVTAALASETLFLVLAVAILRTRSRQGVPDELVLEGQKIRAKLGSDKPFWALVSALVVVGAVLVAMTLTVPAPPLTTQLFVVGPDGTISTLPGTIVANQTSDIIIGVRNGEEATTQFTVTVCLVPMNANCTDPTPMVAEWTTVLAFGPSESYALNLTVPHRASVEMPLRFTVALPGTYSMEIALDGGTSHREVPVRLSVTG